MTSSFRRRPESSDVSWSTSQAYLDPGFHREDDGPMFLRTAFVFLFSCQSAMSVATDTMKDENGLVADERLDAFVIPAEAGIQ